MRRVLKYFICFIILTVQSVSFAAGQVHVKGVVKDITSDKSFPGVIVELHIFESE